MPAPPEFHNLRHPPLTLERFRARCAVQHYNEGNFAWLAGDPCVYCGRSLADLRRGQRGFRPDQQMSREHLIPQSKLSVTRVKALGLPVGFGRGQRGWENLAPACRECNTARGSSRWLVWLIRQAETLGPSRWHPFRPGWPRPDPRSTRPLTHRLELALISDQTDTA